MSLRRDLLNLFPLEVVTHCWRYSRLLQYQLSSLVLYPPRNGTILTVCYAQEDARTVKVLNWFRRCEDWPPTVLLRDWPMEPERLWRRAIGRHAAALSTLAQVVWFTDCDHVFGEGCLDAAYERFPDGEVLAYPRQTWRHQTHAMGDAAIARADEQMVLAVDPAEFEQVENRRAIGGIQLVKGDAARRQGYCPGGKWQRPAAGGFQKCRCDVAFRRQLGTSGVPIEVPNLFRLRHSQCGRQDPQLEL